MFNMPGFRHKIALIIPTRNRLGLLTKLLQSLQEQTVQANQIVIADGSDQPIESGIKQFSSLPISYVRVFPPSLPKQRNEGIKALDKDITLVGYLDDDIVMEKDAVEAMLRFWERCSDDIGGSSFNITNNLPLRLSLFSKLFFRLFCLSNGRKGAILRSGFSTPVAPVLEDIYTDWLSGGATVWRRQILEEFKYDEWYKGWAYTEDLDFSFTVSKRYKLVVLHSARVQHFPPPYNLKRLRSFGKTTIKQRHHFVKKHPQLSIPLFYWATLGRILNNVLYGIVKRRMEPILTALGYIAGVFDILRGNLVQADEEFRG